MSWVSPEGPSQTIERRHADSKLERLPALAAELAKVRCDVFFGQGLEANLAALLGSGLWAPARKKMTELALQAGLASVFHASQWAQAGGLMSSGFNFSWMWRRACVFAGSSYSPFGAT